MLIAKSNYGKLCHIAEHSYQIGKPFNEVLVIDHYVKSKRKAIKVKRYINVFSEVHPFGLSNALCWIKYKFGFYMGAQYRKDKPIDLNRMERLFSPKKGLCDGIKDITKHLGLMTIERAIPLFIMLIAKTGNITPESLANADAYDDNGNLIILTWVGDGNNKRITVTKDRAHDQKKSILDDELTEIIELIISMTEPYRTYLRSKGHAHWNKLWLYQKQECGVPQVIRPYSFQRQFSKFFLLKHPELAQYSCATARNIRVSVGVVKYFETLGDIEAAARTYGNTVKISMDCYIPKSVQYAMYRRQIRRHQNLLLMAATAGEHYYHRVTDFRTTEDLHEFLSQMLDDPNRVKGNSLLRILNQKINGAGAQNGVDDENINDEVMSGDKIVVHVSSMIWAVLFLYKEHVENSSMSALNVIDIKTKTSPWAWHELASTIHAEIKLPTHRQFKPIYEEALSLMDEYRKTIHF